MSEDVQYLALVLHYAINRSRRQAKRLLRECGGVGTAAELDSVLAHIDAHPQRAAIHEHAGALAEAQREVETARTTSPRPRVIDEWLIGEGPLSGRTYLAYFGVATAFVVEVFEDAASCPPDARWCDADEGQVLGNLLWLDSDSVPDAEEEAALAAEAVRQLRIYDARIGLIDEE